MTIQPTLERLHELRLTGMAQALEEQMHMSDMESLTFEDRLALLLERETTVRTGFDRRPGTSRSRTRGSTGGRSGSRTAWWRWKRQCRVE